MPLRPAIGKLFHIVKTADVGWPPLAASSRIVPVFDASNHVRGKSRAIVSESRVDALDEFS
jgi:hypothetical protein